MTTDVSARVRKLAEYHDAEESKIIQQAVEKGAEEQWRTVVITQYLDGKLSREEAVDELGRDAIREVDTAARYVEEDVDWGLNA